VKAETVIVGGGPGGSAMAMFLLREGIRPVIIERESFPRYHIGESLTGAGGKVLRDLGLDGEMYRRKYPTKQGVEVYGQSKRGSWFVPVTGRDENWKLFPWDTWQVRRSDFDTMMLKEAEARGAVVIPGRALKPLLDESGAIRGVRVEHAHNGKGIEDIETQMLVDASGQATWLANLGHTGPKYRGSYDHLLAGFRLHSRGWRYPRLPPGQHPDLLLEEVPLGVVHSAR
jgi:flavin-dependent dehydrogenase